MNVYDGISCYFLVSIHWEMNWNLDIDRTPNSLVLGIVLIS